jgi:spore germination protein
MKPFQYADGQIGNKEALFLLPSYIHGVVILTAPRIINEVTHSFDGWIALLAGGIIGTVFAWITAKLAARFPGTSFLDYAGQIVTRPVAYVLMVMIAVHFMLITAYETAAMGGISQMYLLPNTPYEVSSLAFLLILVYAVSGSRVGLLRLNLMFFPIYMFVLIATHFFAIGDFEAAHLKPMFITDIPTLVRATGHTLLTVVGYEILLLYTKFSRDPEKVPKASFYGMVISVVILMFSYVMVIGVMGNRVPTELVFPTIEMVKEAVIPGGFVERSDILFFVIWTMSIFNTGALAFDAVLLSLELMFPSLRKIHGVLLMAPVIYMISMQPATMIDILDLLKVDIYLQVPLSFIVPPLLLTIAAIRKLPKRGEPV